ncbi:tellurite resistance TerB family protein [Bowmanella dokdonensis]|uniref:TerB family tellurite resistance protein n=1 Tax=Bowmanella dokdonensis TaxID=751969 RepID=A0A939ISU6_9ALTE|nr:TerB family tellurite resistance protein [Bowmanella dokdonensis]MBN7826801.1 TerB family tellurite resistance protein [Bowmanella dokdonensis]
MIARFRRWVQDNLAQPEQSQSQLQLDLATAVLYCEVVRADNELGETELALMQDLLTAQFSLSEQQAKSLLESSSEQVEHAADLVSFTRLIHEQCTHDEKIRIVEHLWQLAYADDHLDPHEEHMIRRIADLLYLSHGQFIQAKLKAQEGAILS